MTPDPARQIEGSPNRLAVDGGYDVPGLDAGSGSGAVVTDALATLNDRALERIVPLVAKPVVGVQPGAKADRDQRLDAEKRILEACMQLVAVVQHLVRRESQTVDDAGVFDVIPFQAHCEGLAS